MAHFKTTKKIKLTDASAFTFGIAVAEWHDRITGKLLSAAVETLKNAGAKEKNIHIEFVPGSFELPLLALRMAKKQKN